jgi:hypothetical protein
VRTISIEAAAVSDPVVFQLDADADRLFMEWRRHHEPRLRPETGDFAPFVEWASKLPGQVLRLAANLHALRIGSIYGTIIGETMGASLAMADYFVGHARKMFGTMRSDAPTADAALVLRWAQERRLEEASPGRSTPRRIGNPAGRVTHWRCSTATAGRESSSVLLGPVVSRSVGRFTRKCGAQRGGFLASLR